MSQFSAVQRSSSKRQSTADDVSASSTPIKRHDSDRSSNIGGSLQFEFISVQELQGLLQMHLATPLPECDEMFPWLHSYSTTPPPSFPNAVSIIRSQPMSEGWIQNSGILRCSLDPHDFLMTWGNDKNQQFRHCDRNESAIILREVMIRELAKVKEVVNEDDMNDAVQLCLQYNVLPFLTTDAYARETYGLKKGCTVSNSHQAAAVLTPKQPGSFRRFDIQSAKMLEMSPAIVIYCFEIADCHNFSKNPCRKCNQMAKVLRIALNLIQRSYSEKKSFEVDIKILKYASIDEIPKSLIGTAPMSTTTLNKITPQQLVSQFDVESFNNWERGLLYREQLEMSKMSSASVVEQSRSVWCGNCTDYQVYKLLKKCGHLNEGQPSHPPCFSTENSIVKLKNIKFSPDCQEAVDTKFFNITNPEKEWSMMIRCTESAAPPSLEKLWECLANALNDRISKPAEFNFPSSGTITLGSLNINSIKVILNTCFIIHQLTSMEGHGVLIYCSDGYTETTFLLVSYLIFLWDLSLEDTLVRLHTEFQRPFFLFHMDLQVLGHLQTLLRNFSPKRTENAALFQSPLDGQLQPLEITPEMFSKIFLFRIPAGSDFSNLKGPLPSRILPHMYLGSLEHAQSPELLRKLGINYIVSVGENLSWVETSNQRNRASSSPIPTPASKVMSNFKSRNRGFSMENNQKNNCIEENQSNDSFIDFFEKEEFKILRVMNLGDNGKDALTHQFEHILKFIGECHDNNGKVLVHCMVGVSRSATVCIAECMKRLQCDVLRAYIFVRVRRLNIIIQPNLMFMYELLKWQEQQLQGREIDWHIICRSISELNTNYI